MGKFLVLLALVVIGVWFARRALARAERDERPPPTASVPDELVSCAQCGMLLPRGEARGAGAGVYCSEEHARLGPRRR
jgi:uncharacterized protein